MVLLAGVELLAELDSGVTFAAFTTTVLVITPFLIVDDNSNPFENLVETVPFNSSLIALVTVTTPVLSTDTTALDVPLPLSWIPELIVAVTSPIIPEDVNDLI